MADKTKAVEAAKAIATGTDAKAMAKAQADELAKKKANALVPGALRKQIIKTREIKDRLEGNIGGQVKAQVESKLGQGLSGPAARAMHMAKNNAPSLLGMLGIGAVAGAAAGKAQAAQGEATKAAEGAQAQAGAAAEGAQAQAGGAIAEAQAQLPPGVEPGSPEAVLALHKPPTDLKVVEDKRSDGSLRAAHEMSGGKLHGASEEYDEDGNIISQGFFEEGNLEGPMTTYDDNGQPKEALDFTDGKLQGRTVQYDEKGRRVLDAEFHDGVMHGEALFYRDGKLAMKMHFNKGVAEGQATTYDDNENPIVEQFYINGNLNGPSKTYSKAGELTREEQYFENVLHGTVIDYFETTGEQMRVCRYVFGKRIGECTEYYDDGTLRREETYLNDLLEGEVLAYYPNGVIMEKSVYREGKIKGEAQRFDTHGDPMSMPGSDPPGTGKGALSSLMKRIKGE